MKHNYKTFYVTSSCMFTTLKITYTNDFEAEEKSNILCWISTGKLPIKKKRSHKGCFIQLCNQLCYFTNVLVSKKSIKIKLTFYVSFLDILGCHFHTLKFINEV